MKKLVCIILSVCMLGLVLCACSDSQSNDDGYEVHDEGLPLLKIGVSVGRVPQEEIFGTMASRIAKKGYKIEYVEFETAAAANEALAAGEIDLSLISQRREFAQFDEENPDALLNLGVAYYYPYGIYLCNFESKEDIVDGATIALPDDAEGLSRSLRLLAAEGYITLREGTGTAATLEDIEENPHSYAFETQSAETIAENIAGGKADIALMASTTAIDAGYKVNKYAIAIERIENDATVMDYSTVMLINAKDISSEKYKAVEPLYFSAIMYECIDGYTGSLIVPAFSVSPK